MSIRWLVSLGCKVLGLALVVAATAAPALACDVDAPEIDPGSIGSTATLLVGGALVIADRFGRR
jgi:hypothetical protein